MEPDRERPIPALSAESVPPEELEARVEIETEAPNPRQRRLLARIAITAAPEVVWGVLSDYEALPEFIPNLVACNRLECPDGGVRLEQIGAQSLMKVNFKARVVLDLEEDFPSQIRFQQVEGDFRSFEGYWQLDPHGDRATQLTYSLFVWPPRVMPVRFIEGRLRRDLATNLVAIQQRAERLAADDPTERESAFENSGSGS